MPEYTVCYPYADNICYLIDLEYYNIKKGESNGIPTKHLLTGRCVYFFEIVEHSCCIGQPVHSGRQASLCCLHPACLLWQSFSVAYPLTAQSVQPAVPHNGV
jgi:hypothetical protein